MSTKSATKTNYLHIGIILLLGMIACGYTFESKVELLGDNGDYYTLSKAIAQGKGYVMLSHPKEVQNNHYPPGFPALLSPIMWVTDGSIMAAKLFNSILFLGALILVYLIAAQWLNNTLALILTVFVALNSHILFYASIMMSEVPYLFFSLLTIYAFTQVKEKFSFKDKYLYITLVALIVTYYIRALGVALLLGLVIHLLIEKRGKHAIFFFVALIVAAAPWMVRSANLGGSSYFRQMTQINPYQPSMGKAELGDFIDRIGENIERYITKEIPAAFYPSIEAQYQQDASIGDYFWGLVLITIGLVGLWQITKYRFLLLAYLLATFGILMLWPQVWIGVRFIVPIVPLFYIGVGAFFQYIYYKKLKQKESDWKPYLLILLVLPLLSPVKKLHEDAEAPYFPGWRAYFEAAEWINKNTEEDAVVATGKPQLFYLYSGRPNVRFLFTENQQQLLDHLKENDVDFVIIDQVYGNTLRYLLPVVQDQREKFELVHQIKNPETFILRLKE